MRGIVLGLWLVGNGWAQAVELAAGDSVTCAAAGDLNGDGAVDLVFGNEAEPLHLMVGDGRGGFSTLAGAFGADTGAVTAIVLLDVDADGRLDVCLGSDGGLTRLWRNLGDGRFGDESNRLPPDRPSVRAIAAGDLDGDGRVDLVLADFAGGSLVYRNRGGKLVGVPGALPAATSSASNLALADLDGDGDLDLVLARQPTATGQGGENRAFRNDGGLRFTDVTEAWMPSDRQRTTCVALADLDGDGVVDLVCGNHGMRNKEPARNTVHRRDPAGRFLNSVKSRYDGAPDATRAVAVADLDGDGDLDLAFGNDGPEAVFLNDGHGAYRASGWPFASDDDTCALLVVDADGDPHPDLVAANHGGPSRLYRNPGSGGVPVSPGEAKESTPAGARTASPPPDLRRVAQGKFLPRLEGRKKLTNAKVRAAIERGLAFLASHQSANGCFDSDGFADPGSCGDPLHDVGLTGLALLCFLADYSLPNHGEYQANVRRGLEWLTTQQGGDGLVGTEASHSYVYDHALATLALAEAALLSGDERWQGPLRKAVARLEDHRNPYRAWRYQRRGSDDDTSVTAWCVSAWYTAAECGVTGDARVGEGVLSFLDDLTDDTGRTGYLDKGGLSSRHKGQHEIDFPPDAYEGMTGAAVYARLLLGEAPATSEKLRLGVGLVAAKRPRPDQFDSYAWLHCANALAQCGGREAKVWRDALHDVLLAAQVDGGDMAGSFSPRPDVWGADAGCFGTTAMAILALQAEYRHAPMLDARGRRRTGR